MGGKSSHTTIERHYVDNPALVQQIKDLQAAASTNSQKMEEVNKALEEEKNKRETFEKETADLKATLENTTDPTQYAKVKKECFDKFLQKLDPSLFNGKLYALDGKKHIGMYGSISTGKSSLINALFGQDLCQVGVGETTTEVKKIGEISNLVIWDLPGNSTHFNFLIFEQIAFLKSLSKICLVVQSSLNDPFYHDILKICARIQQPVVIIINKIDLVDEVDRSPLQLQIKRELVAHYGKEAPIFMISAKNQVRGVLGYCEWQQMQDALVM